LIANELPADPDLIHMTPSLDTNPLGGFVASWDELPQG
jgi:hypothetical protein